MELRHLRYFVAVAEELHFRRAAERLHMSQPPLSQQIKTLEAEVGVQLLRRTRRSVELTPAGVSFLQDARGVLASVDRAVQTARQVERGQLGDIAVGFVGSALYGWVPELLNAFRRARPEVDVHLRELTSTAQAAALLDERIDVGFLRPPVEGDGLVLESMGRERMVVALPADHRLAGERRIDLHDLAEDPIVMLSRSEAPGVHAAVEGALVRAGTVARVVQEVAELQTAVGLVAAGLGVSLVPESLTALSRAGVVYRPLDGPVPEVELVLAHREGTPAPVVRAFLDVARTWRHPRLTP